MFSPCWLIHNGPSVGVCSVRGDFQVPQHKSKFSNFQSLSHSLRLSHTLSGVHFWPWGFDSHFVLQIARLFKCSQLLSFIKGFHNVIFYVLYFYVRASISRHWQCLKTTQQFVLLLWLVQLVKTDKWKMFLRFRWPLTSSVQWSQSGHWSVFEIWSWMSPEWKTVQLSL